MSRRQIDKAAMVRDAPMPEQPGQQTQARRGNRGVDVWLLPIKCLGSTACRQAVPFIRSSMGDRGKEFVHARQSLRAILMMFPQWLAKDELAPVGQVASVEPIVKASRFQAYHLSNCGPRRARVHT